MGKMFKGVTGKIFSIALVLCMVASMLPAITVSATAIGESVTYDFTEPDNGTDLNMITETSGYNWSYGGSKTTGYTAKVDSNTSGKFLTMSGTNSKGARPKGVWYALKINAPSVGIYSAELAYRQLAVSDGYSVKGDIYLIPETVVNEATGNSFDKKIDSLIAQAADAEDKYIIHKGILYSGASNEMLSEELTGKITVDGSEFSYYILFRKPIDDDETYVCKDGTTKNTFNSSDRYEIGGHGSQYPISLTLTKTADIKKEYTFTYDFNQGWEKDAPLKQKTYEDTKQSWMFDSASRFDVAAKASNETRDYMAITGSSSDARIPGMWAALKLKTPVAGEYAAVLTHGRIRNSQGNTLGDIYWIPVNDVIDGVETALSDNTYKKYDDVEYFNNEDSNKWDATTDLGTFEVKEGNTEHYIVFRIPLETTASSESSAAGYFQMFPASLTLTAGSSLAYMGTNLNVTDELTVGDTSAVTATGFLSDGSVADGVAISTLTSSNTSVVEVENGSIKAVGAGKATISADITYNGESVGTATKEITVQAPVVEETVKVAIDDDGDGTATVEDATLGTDVVATAVVPSGKVFRGWVRGSATNGRLVSTENPYTFKALTNTYLTAIYTDVPESGATEYYNWNGEFLGTGVPAKEPTLLGYAFANTWKDAGKVGEISRKIAEFNKVATSFDIAKEGDFTMDKADSLYDTEVTCTSEKDVYWYRDNKLVDYGKEYTFFIWDETNITTSDKGHDGAKIMLDKAKSGSWMIEYDAGEVGEDNILEVGIVFGNADSTPTVEVCEEKMSSQRDDFTHGQFAATSDYQVARGYLIYNDNGTYRVIYAD